MNPKLPPVAAPQFTKLGGKAWGVRGPAPEPKPGDRITVTTRTGQARTVTIGFILSREPGGAFKGPDGTPRHYPPQWLASLATDDAQTDPNAASPGYNGPRKTAKVKRVAYYQPTIEAAARHLRAAGNTALPSAVVISLLAEAFALSQNTITTDIAGVPAGSNP